MLNTVEAIAELLQGSFLADREIRQLAIDESDQSAFVIEVDSSTKLDAWTLMRSHLEATKRYPVLTEEWGSKEWASNNFFSRFFYTNNKFDGAFPDTSPGAIIANAPTADLDAFLERYKASSAAYLEDSIEYSLDDTRERFGSSPNPLQIRELIDQGSIQSPVDLEKWLFDWELQNFNYEVAIAPLSTTYLDWFDSGTETTPLILLPTMNGWDSLAYMHWYGACSSGTTVAISFLKKWHQRYKAELVCHYGTMLQLMVGKLPSTPEEAFELAWEQEALAQCTIILPGVPLRDHARSLLAVDRWFIHERP